MRRAHKGWPSPLACLRPPPVVTNYSVNAPADVMFSSALIYAGVPEHPEGHDMVV
jgi:hypothetical protein